MASSSFEETMVASLSYRGTEVLLLVPGDAECGVVHVICPRTLGLRQTLSYAYATTSSSSSSFVRSNDLRLCGMQAHSVSGHICLYNSRGQLLSYRPVANEEEEEEAEVANKHHHSPYWSLSSVIDTTQYFTEASSSSSISCAPGKLSLTQHGHVLLACGSQLALFDTHATAAAATTASPLLWITACPHPIRMAHISGPGRSVALVLTDAHDDDEKDTAAAEGVHTFQRLVESDDLPAPSSLQQPPPCFYQPGPFWVHAAPVTHLSYRGYGCHDTLHSAPDDDPDLCLTFDAQRTARIFAQDHCLLEWNTPPHTTQVGWISCCAALTLADFDAAVERGSDDTALRSPSSLSYPPVAPSSFHVPTSQAGAWLYERAALGPAASQIRISRLSYLPRGLDEWHPTLETLATVTLPASSTRVLSVEGLWPAWSPGPPCEMRILTAPSSMDADVAPITLWECTVVQAPLEAWELGPPRPTVLARPTRRRRYCHAQWMAQVSPDGGKDPNKDEAITIQLSRRPPAVLSLSPTPEATSIRHWVDDSVLPAPVQWWWPGRWVLPEALVTLLWSWEQRLVARGQSGTVWVWSLAPPPEQGSEHPPRKTASVDGPPEYTVAITPDPEFGLGLRLEAPPDGTGALVASFKRHPTLGEALPAERCGRIQRGDILLGVNDVTDLGTRPFDDIVTAVREAAAGPGRPLRLQLRRAAGRRSREEMLGVVHPSPKLQLRRGGGEEKRSPSPALIEGGETAVEATFWNVLPRLSEEDIATADARVALIPLDRDDNVDTTEKWEMAVMVWADGNTLSGALLVLSASGDRDQAQWVVLGSHTLAESPDVASIVQMDVFDDRGSDSCMVAVGTQMSQVYVVSISMTIGPDLAESSASWERYLAFDMKSRWPLGSMLRAYSSLLMGTMPVNALGFSDTICIWTFSPRPGTVLDPACSVDDAVTADYFATEVCSVSEDNAFVDFGFLRTGTLDSLPSLVAYSKQYVTLYQKYRGNTDWIPCTRISYHRAVPTETLSFGHAEKPLDVFPHLPQLLCSVHISQDEATFLRSDWHAESLLAHICSHKEGPKAALRGAAKSVLLWLASESANGRGDGAGAGSLVVAPLPIIENHVDSRDLANTNGDVMAALTSRVKENPETTMIRDFLAFLFEFIGHMNSSPLTLSLDIPVPSFPMDSENKNAGMSLPPVLRSASMNELRMLLAIGELVVDPPQFEGLDPPAQLCVFCCTLMEKISEGLRRIVPQTSKTRSMPAHGVLVRSMSSGKDGCSDALDSIASAGTFAALLSSDQASVMKISRLSSQRMTWQFVRERRIAYWERSDTALAGIAEEIGSAIFLETRDIMECAIFYIIAGKLSTLKNLSKGDQTIPGRTFAKFLTDYDFASERGRRAAEKNAFSLLRKCRYQVASAFFLLADPPFLNAALETISTKLCDVDLAFFIARLVERPDRVNSLPSGYSGVLGGGGGYADVGMHNLDISSKARFGDWKPTLGKETQKLLVDRILPATSQDQIMTAICLLWLGKRNEAAWFISRIVDVKFAGLTRYSVADDAAQTFFESIHGIPQLNRKLRRPLSLLSYGNAIIDFFSVAALLKQFGASARVRLAASLVVSDALSSFGIELTSVRNLIDFADAEELEDNQRHTMSEENDTVCTSRTSAPNSFVPATTAVMMSSIFDDFSAPPPPNSAPIKSLGAKENPSNDMQSSIFDDFEAPLPTKSNISCQSKSVDLMQSSIFDDFTSPSVQKSVGSMTDSMQSSIFNDFIVSPSASGTRIETRLTAASQPPQETASHTIHSSIFDEFDVPNRATNKIVNDTSQNGLGSSVAHSSENVADPQQNLHLDVAILEVPTPKLWYIWRNSLLLDAASRRLLREVATVVSRFHGDISPLSPHDFSESDSDILGFSGAAEILLIPCDPLRIMSRIHESLLDLSTLTKLSRWILVQRSIGLLGPSHCARMLFCVMLNAAIERHERAEVIVRQTSAAIVQKCYGFSLLHNDLKQNQSRGSLSPSERREAARLSWQLESCLWLHRGGALTLSSDAVKECTIAVRIGILLAIWNRDFDCIEAMIFNEPDCMFDDDLGRQLWVSLKDMDALKESLDNDRNGDGWEFRVDCKRHQATELLRHSSTGCFLIRPSAEDNGVFTLSFKTNMEPAVVEPPEEKEYENFTPDTSGDELSDVDRADRPRRLPKKKVRKDDVVQHAIIRLSESGFRCGSFGPFTSLMSLLQSVSSSLPFELRFDLPPKHRVYKEERPQTSPNAVFFRKLNLHRSNSSSMSRAREKPTKDFRFDIAKMDHVLHDGDSTSKNQMTCFGTFAQLVLLCQLRRQFSKIAAYFADDEDDGKNQFRDVDDVAFGSIEHTSSNFEEMNNGEARFENSMAIATNMLRPFLSWVRKMEMITANELLLDSVPDAALPLRAFNDATRENSDSVVTEASAEAIEVSPQEHVPTGIPYGTGDAVLRGMIRPESGIEFSTLRLVDAGECTMLVLFSRSDALRWLVTSGIDATEETALQRLERMEEERVIESVDLNQLPLKHKSVEGVRYRFVDPWEVEALPNREGETRSAALGRERYVPFTVERVAAGVTDHVFRQLGGGALLELWSKCQGDALLTQALAAAHPPWERSGTGDVQLTNGKVSEPPPFLNSIRRYLYRNSLYRRLDLPQRFVALIQVELLDLKNLTTPGGSLSLTAYALLRLKRVGSNGVLSYKARTIDSASTQPIKLNKTSVGPNAPASWGSVVRFRFPLPEDASVVDGTSPDRDREALFKGPPRLLQMSVYVKKLLADNALGTADVNMDGLSANGQLEEWVPLRSEKHGITWFARIRLTLRFELMCLADGNQESIPSVGLQRIYELTHKSGGSVHEDMKQRSLSSSDLKNIAY